MLHLKVATTIFSRSNGGQAKAEAALPEIRLAVAEPELDVGNIETALEVCSGAKKRSTKRRRLLPLAQGYVTRDLFELLMHDEKEHIDFLETQLDLIAKLHMGSDHMGGSHDVAYHSRQAQPGNVGLI